MRMDRSSIYKSCLVIVIVLLILTMFCLLNLRPDSASFYLCIFSLIIDVPFLIFLIYKELKNYRNISKK